MNFLKASSALLCLSFILLPLATADEHDDSVESETTEASDSEQSESLEPVIVTGTLGPRTIGESLSSVTVIDEEQLRREGPSEFAELLRGQPGINIVTNGSFGKNTSVLTRGTSSKSSVLLVDGVRLRSATLGTAPWQYFPMALVERVEIVRGPRSSLYGADAVGGVVQAFTLDPDQGQAGWLEAGAGNLNTQQYSGGAAARFGRTRISLSSAFTNTDGAPVVDGGEPKGFNNAAGLGRVAHDLPNGGEVSATVMQAQGNTEFEGGNTDFLIRTIGLGMTTPVSNDWLTTIQLSEALDQNDNERDSGDSRFDTRTRTSRWENTLFLGNHELALGAELQYDEVDSTAEYEESSRANGALFSQLSLNFGAADLELALRHDDNEAFGNHTTGAVSAGYVIGDQHRVRASYGTSFRAPTFNELYAEDFGDPDLNLESGSALEVGVSGRYQNWNWDLAVYQLDIDNLIITVDDNGNFYPANVNAAQVRGMEVTTGYDANDWYLNLSATLQDPRDSETDKRLRRRSAQSLRLSADRDLGAWSLGSSVVAIGDRFEDTDNEERLPAYAIVNVRGSWTFARNWTTRLKVDNVLDEQYVTAAGYIPAGTTGLLSIRYDFQ